MSCLSGALVLLTVAGLSAVALVMLASLWRPRWAPWLGALVTSVVTAALCWGWATGTERIVDLAWLSVSGSRFRLALDPLGAPLAVFTAAILVPILLYTRPYLSRHLEEHGRPLRDTARFCGQMVAFMLSMLTLLLAQDLLLMFAALELTALASFLLIEFDRRSAEARTAANMALVVTVGSSLFFLLGALMLAEAEGTTLLEPLTTQLADPTGPKHELALACLVLGVLGKSAQVPLHFWLPRAMAAPTPVSAYLHSAALVSAGVFVVTRLMPLWQGSRVVPSILLAVGAASMTLGSLRALSSDGLKRILAFSTIAQYGYMVLLLALGGPVAQAQVPFLMVAHGLCKSALFMSAGAVSMATGAHRLSQTGGLLARMPVLALVSAVASAGLIGLPLTVGYFRDEFLFAAALERGTWAAAALMAAAAFTFAYAARFWLGLFTGATKRNPEQRALGRSLTLPIVPLAVLVLLGGTWTGPFEAAFVELGPDSDSFELEYHLSSTSASMGYGAWALGALLLLLKNHRMTQERGRNWLKRSGLLRFGRNVAALPDQMAPGVHRLARQLHRLDGRLLRAPMQLLLLPIAALLGLAVADERLFEGTLVMPAPDHWPLIAGLSLTAGAVVVTLRARSRVALVVLVSFVGFAIALVFALSGAPNVALVMVIVETTLTILFLALLWQIRPEVLARQSARGRRERAFGFPGAVAFVVAFAVAAFALGRQRQQSVALEHARLAESAHTEDVVTAILSDFRGLDTVGELSVLAIAVIGACSISWGRE